MNDFQKLKIMAMENTKRLEESLGKMICEEYPIEEIQAKLDDKNKKDTYIVPIVDWRTAVRLMPEFLDYIDKYDGDSYSYRLLCVDGKYIDGLWHYERSDTVKYRQINCVGDFLRKDLENDYPNYDFEPF